MAARLKRSVNGLHSNQRTSIVRVNIVGHIHPLGATTLGNLTRLCLKPSR
jgi:hypothetical protein